MNEYPSYTGKPTAYLDHNVLDLFLKRGPEGFIQGLLERCQIVYSDETLREIQRSTGYEKEFLTLLNRLGAMHLKLFLEQPGFMATDQVTLTKRDAFEAYEEFCQSQTSIDAMLKAMQQLPFKILGGRSEESIADILAEQKMAFADFLSRFVAMGQDIPSDFPLIVDGRVVQPQEMQLLMTKSAEQMYAAFAESTQLIEDRINEQFKDTVGWDVMKKLREELNAGPKILNNIEEPDIVKKVWSQCEGFFRERGETIDLEDFFQLKLDPSKPYRPRFNHQKVNFIYMNLNMLGYYPDSKLNKDRRFIAAMSDQSHASLASFCGILLSMDANFIMKVGAAYEYLGIPTEVLHVKLKEPEISE